MAKEYAECIVPVSYPNPRKTTEILLALPRTPHIHPLRICPPLCDVPVPASARLEKTFQALQKKVSVTRTLAERNRFYTTFQEPEHPAKAACTFRTSLELKRLSFIGLIFVGAASLIKEPDRQRFITVMVAGTGAAYLSGFGMGGREFAFTAAVTYCAFRGLTSYSWIGIGWMLHTAWYVVHHIYGIPLLPFAAGSSLGCAICDPVIALWCLAGTPALGKIHGKRTSSVGDPA